jgi:hypothetical protein
MTNPLAGFHCPVKTCTYENRRVTFPEDHVSTFAKHEHVKEIEKDGKVTTQ